MTHSPSYAALIATRPAFRRMWTAALLSQCGDWMTLLALYSRMLDESGSVASTGAMVALRMLPSAIVAPWAGVWADRVSRKGMLIACDVLRAVIVLGFIFADSPERLWLVFALTLLQHSLGAVFDPTEQAAIASVVRPNEIVAAHTLHALSWSAMLSVGSVLGGIIVATWGPTVAFTVNALTYLASAALVARADIPFSPRPTSPAPWADLTSAMARVRASASLKQALYGKSGWAMSGGGALVMYAVMGDRTLTMGSHGAGGIGVLLSMRGVGALLGPLIARRLGGDSDGWLRTAVGAAYLWTALGYIGLSQAPSLFWGAFAILLAHLAISTQWVFTNALIARGVEDAMRGRMFAFDTMLSGLAMGVSSFLAGLIIDHTSLGPREVMLGIAGMQVAAFFGWKAWSRGD